MRMEMPLEWRFAGGAVPRYAPGSAGFVGPEEWARYLALAVPEVNSAFRPAWWYRNRFPAEPVLGPCGVFARPIPAVLEADIVGRSLPVWYKADIGAGKYRVSATLTGIEDGREVLCFLSRRRLIWRGALQAGEQISVQGLCDVSPIVAVGGGDAAQGDLGRIEDTSVDITVVGASLTALRITPWEGTSLLLMGDSTVTDQPAELPYAPGETYAGWGQVLPLYLGGRYCVSNHAHNGLSTETFRDRGHYALVQEQMRPGDLVLLQFGHNDQKRLHLAPELGYRENLLRYIREIRERRARPVLVTSLARNTWATPDRYNDMLQPFADSMMRIGAEEDVPVLDLHGVMKQAICTAGMDAARIWFHPRDYTHTNDFGAHMAAGFVVSEMARCGLAEIPSAPAWEPYGPFTGLTAPPEAGPAPAGTKVLVDYGLIPDAPWPIT